MVNRYVPDRGDVVWMDFSPHAGREQAGRQPALVLSSRAYNRKTGRCLACTVTSRIKGYPFELRLPAACAVQGAVLVDHVKNQDWQARRAERADTVSGDFADQVADLVDALMRGA